MSVSPLSQDTVMKDCEINVSGQGREKYRVIFKSCPLRYCALGIQLTTYKKYVHVSATLIQRIIHVSLVDPELRFWGCQGLQLFTTFLHINW